MANNLRLQIGNLSGCLGDAIQKAVKLVLKNASMIEVRKFLIFAFILVGFVTIIGQIVLIRQLLTIFCGNELSIGIVLGIWLLSTASGSFILGMAADYFKNRFMFFAYTQTSLAIFLPASLFLSRSPKILSEISIGEVVGFFKMIVISCSVLAPFCFFSGSLFALGCLLLADHYDNKGKSVGVVFFLEAIGAALGGIAFHFFLVNIFNPVQITLLMSVLLLLSTLFLTFFQKPMRFDARGLPAVLLVFTVSVLVFGSSFLEKMSREWEWKGYRLIDSHDTIYGNLAVISRGDQISFYENGQWNFTYPDLLTAEESVHFALLQHPDPKSVLLIGGGISSATAQVLKHPSVASLDYVELDPGVIALGLRYLPEKAVAATKDHRVSIYHMDGRAFVKKALSNYDVVIVNLPDPKTAQLNRFYTVEFFQEAAQKLRKGGVLSFSVTSSENVIGYALADFLGSLYTSASAVFKDVVVFPGDPARFFGAMSENALVSRPDLLVERIKDRQLDLKYVRGYYILSNLSPMRLNYVLSRIRGSKVTKLNRDLNPICYFYNTVLWGAQHSPMMKTLFLRLSKIEMGWFFYGIVAFTLVLLLIASRQGTKRFLGRTFLLYSVLIVGYTEIALEVIIVLAFQIFYGYVYYKIGILLTLFTVGLAIGSWIIVRFLDRIGNRLKVLLEIQAGMAAYCIALVFPIRYLQGIDGALGCYAEPMTLSFAFIAGFLGGMHFPLANSIYLTHGKKVGKIAGLLYGIDLIGHSAGAILASVLLLPIYGIAATLYVLGALNVSAFILLSRMYRSHPMIIM